MFPESTKTTKDESLPITVKVEKMSSCQLH